MTVTTELNPEHRPSGLIEQAIARWPEGLPVRQTTDKTIGLPQLGEIVIQPSKTADLCIWRGAYSISDTSGCPDEAHELVTKYGGHTIIDGEEGAVLIHAAPLKSSYGSIYEALEKFASSLARS